MQTEKIPELTDDEKEQLREMMKPKELTKEQEDFLLLREDE